MRSRKGSVAMAGVEMKILPELARGGGPRPKGVVEGPTAQAIASATAPLRQSLRACHLPETSSGRI